MLARPRVLLAYKSFPEYRRPLYEGMRTRLSASGVDFDVVVGDPVGLDRDRGDQAKLPWVLRRRNRVLTVLGRNLVYQPIFRLARRYDLVIVEQASKLLLNYPLLILGRVGLGPAVALWGHGENKQKSTSSVLGENLKSLFSRLPTWWFAYTPGVKSFVSSLPFPSERITVLNNTIDTRDLRGSLALVTAEDIARFRTTLTIPPDGKVLLFLGSVYAHKKWSLLLKSFLEECDIDSGEHLIFIGGGPDLEALREMAREVPNVHILGPAFGRDKALALAACDVVAIPGLIGLPVVDAFTAGVPVLTIDGVDHSPEYEYLEHGVNSHIVSATDATTMFGVAIRRLMDDDGYRETLSEGARRAGLTFSMENMVRNFSDGILDALATLDLTAADQSGGGHPLISRLAHPARRAGSAEGQV